MSTALFLPRELFSPARPAAAPRSEAPRSASASFESGEAVAADLLDGLLDSLPALGQRDGTRRERRRQPRPAEAKGVDLYIR